MVYYFVCLYYLLSTIQDPITRLTLWARGMDEAVVYKEKEKRLGPTIKIEIP